MLAPVCQIVSLMTIRLVDKDGALRFEVHVKPRAKRSRIVTDSGGASGDVLEVAIAAPPVDGAANAELVRLLSDALGVPKRNVEIVRGESSQKKVVAVYGLDGATILERLMPGRDSLT